MKKRILISAEQQNAQVGSFFRELGLELCTEFNKDHLADYLFIVDDYLEELTILPRIQTKKSLSPMCSSGVRGFFDENFVNIESAKSLLSSYFCDALDFDLVDRYSKDFQNVFTLKIHDYLNIGYFIDTIVVEAYKNKFDYDQIRNYLNFAFSYSLKLIEQEGSLLPLDVSFSHDQTGFVVQISMSVPSLDMRRDFNSQSEKLTTFSANANYFDASYFKKRERLLLSSLWFKEKNLQSFKSFFITEIGERHNVTETNSALVNRLDESLEDVEYHSQKLAPNLDSHIDEIIRVLGKKSLKDISVILRADAGLKDANNDVTKVRGWTDFTEEEWKIKRSSLAAQIKERVVVIQSSGGNVAEDNLFQIISEQLNVDPEEVKTVVKGSVEEDVSSKLIKQDKLEDAFALQFFSPQPGQDAAREKLEGQVLRMKKLMEQMRSEIIKLREDANAFKKEEKNPTINEEQSAELVDLKKILTKTLETVKAKEKISLKQKLDFEQILEAKENKNQTLLAQIEQLKDEFSRSREFANEEKLEVLEVENKSLLARVELSKRKINIINENMNKQDNDSLVKKDKELLALKNSIQAAQSMIEKLKQERIDFEYKLNDEREKYIKLKNEKAAVVSSAPKEQTEKELSLINFQAEKKTMEEKLKVQGIELKKLEQKLKFTTAQLEESQKRKAQPAAAASKGVESYIKQIDNANARLGDANNEVTEKKKELIKLKQENILLGHKLTELERKLGHSEKKAA